MRKRRDILTYHIQNTVPLDTNCYVHAELFITVQPKKKAVVFAACELARIPPPPLRTQERRR